MKDKRSDLPIFGALILSFLSSCLIGRRLGARGSAYFFCCYNWMLFFLFLFPAGAAGALKKLVGWRYEGGFYRSAHKIWRSAFVTCLVYALLVLILWLGLGRGIGDSLLLGRSGEMPYMRMLILFVLDALTLVFMGYFDGIGASHFCSSVIFLRQLLEFILLFIFAGRGMGKGRKIAELYKNQEILYTYEAAGVVLFCCIAAGACFLICLLFYLRERGELHHRFQRDSGKRRESPSGLLYSGAFPLCFFFLALYSAEFLGMIIYCRSMRGSGSLLRAYQLGLYLGVYRVAALLPFCIIFILLSSSVSQVSAAVEGDHVAELRVRMKSLSDLSALIAFQFATFQLFLAGPVSSGLFGCDSAMARRLLRFGAPCLLLSGFMLCAAMQLMMLKKIRELLLSALPALAFSLALLFILSGPDRLGIYALLPATGVFSLIMLVELLFFLKRSLRYVPDIRTALIFPALVTLVPAICAMAVALLLGLFLPAPVQLIAAILIHFPLSFVLAGKTGCINLYMLREVPLGKYLSAVGTRLHILK
ncbi:MAG: hypothetical protein IK115_14450 [Lachnospiraceae bacterium]|nr:hypothetical protein [Lachnospiraceae bacterium]